MKTKIILFILLISMSVVAGDVNYIGTTASNTLSTFTPDCRDSVCYICGKPLRICESNYSSCLYTTDYTSNLIIDDSGHLVLSLETGYTFNYDAKDICEICKESFQDNFNTALKRFYDIIRGVKKDEREKNEKAIQEKEKQDLRDKIKSLQEQLKTKEKP